MQQVMKPCVSVKGCKTWAQRITAAIMKTKSPVTKPRDVAKHLKKCPTDLIISKHSTVYLLCNACL